MILPQGGTELTCHSAGRLWQTRLFNVELRTTWGFCFFFPQPTLKSRVSHNRHILRVDRWQVNCVRGGSLSAIAKFDVSHRRAKWARPGKKNGIVQKNLCKSGSSVPPPFPDPRASRFRVPKSVFRTASTGFSPGKGPGSVSGKRRACAWEGLVPPTPQGRRRRNLAQ